MGGMLYCQCKDYLAAVPELAEINRKLSETYAAHIFYYLNRTALLQQIDIALTQADIPYFIVKGSEIAQFYPVPALRTMGDTDIIVHEEDRPRAGEVLESEGLENLCKGDWEWKFRKGDLLFELHGHLLYDEKSNRPEDIRFVDTAWSNMQERTDSGTKYTLSWEFHFVFLILHIRKHFIYSGVGFRQFMDFSTLVRAKRNEIDWTSVRKMLTKLGMMDFTVRCMSCCEKWFHVEMPFSDRRLDSAFFERSEDILFRNGVFGKTSEGEKNLQTYEIISASGSRKRAEFRAGLRNLFPSYIKMRRVPYYAFVDGRPWLLPVAWLYRFLRAVRYGTFSGIASSEQAIQISDISDERLEKRGSLLRQWGL